jgi:hypothetical protein
MPAAGLCWLLLGVVLAFGVAASPAQASRNTHYDFVVSYSSIYRSHFDLYYDQFYISFRDAGSCLNSM